METRKRNIVFDFENTAEAESTGWTHIPPHFQLLRLRLLPSLLPFLPPSILSPPQFPSSSFQPPLASVGKVHCECVLADKVQNYRHTIMVDDLHNILDKPVSSFVLFGPLPPYRPSFASPFLAGCCQRTEWKTTRLQVLFRRRLQVAMQRLPSLQPIKEVHYDRYDYWARSRADAK